MVAAEIRRQRVSHARLAALAFMKKAPKRHGKPEAIVTDGLRSYPAAMRELGNLDRREMGTVLNNRAAVTSRCAEESERC